MDFKSWFCLNQRESFTIDAKINPCDARFYFGRQQLDDRMKKQLARAFVDPQVPKMMVWGPYGCGKTQTLYYLAYGLEKPSLPRARARPTSCTSTSRSKASPRRPTGTSRTWSHSECSRPTWVKTLVSNGKKFEDEVNNLRPIRTSPRCSATYEDGGDLSFNAWRWLSGQNCVPKNCKKSA